jgi:hypothetical protein
MAGCRLERRLAEAHRLLSRGNAERRFSSTGTEHSQGGRIMARMLLLFGATRRGLFSFWAWPQSAPLRAGQAFRRRSFAPIRPNVCADHPAFGADGSPIQVHEHGRVRPAVRVDDCAVMAEAGGAIDQQSPHPMRADMPERDRRSMIVLRSSPSRRIVVGIAMAHS